MITANSVLGNVRRDLAMQERYRQMSARSMAEVVRIHRMESQRVRMRKSTDKGTDIAITLPPGSRLRHGDVVLLTDSRMVVVELEPERVAVVKIKRDTLHDRSHHHHSHEHEHEHKHDHDHEEEEEMAIEIPVRIGHTIGNLHRPIKLEGDTIYFPIQAETELDMFRKLFGRMNEYLEIRGDKIVFEPEEGMDVHEH
jgi:urease accessory protein